MALIVRKIRKFVNQKIYMEIHSITYTMVLEREKNLSFIKESILVFWSSKISTWWRTMSLKLMIEITCRKWSKILVRKWSFCLQIEKGHHCCIKLLLWSRKESWCFSKHRLMMIWLRNSVFFRTRQWCSLRTQHDTMVRSIVVKIQRRVLWDSSKIVLRKTRMWISYKSLQKKECPLETVAKMIRIFVWFLLWKIWMRFKYKEMLLRSCRRDIRKIMSSFSMCKIRYWIRLSSASILQRIRSLFCEERRLCILDLKMI